MPSKQKTAVDPNPLIKDVTHPITSDEFFAQNKETFDLIFIDGLHLSEQVEKDLENSIKVLNDGGFIVVHDCNPPTEAHARRNRLSHPMAEWNGDVFQAAINFRANYQDYTFRCVDTDWGVGIISKGKAEKELIKNGGDVEWWMFDQNRKELLNLISVDEFKKLYC